MNGPHKIFVSAEENGIRLDHLITARFPWYGARKAKRLVHNGLIRLNGKIASPSQKVKTGDVATFSEPESALPDGVKILAAGKDYLFLHKPAHLHSVSLAGSSSPSLENWLRNAVDAREYSNYLLAQRLDYATSGIVLAASGTNALQEFRKLETTGNCEKLYLALLQGHLERPIVIKQGLATNGGQKSKITGQEADVLRHTAITPLFHLENELPAKIMRHLQMEDGETPIPKKMTLAGCSIKRGARHQIRAHAAAGGFPLIGDGLYNPQSSIKDKFLLHQTRLRFGNFSCVDLPLWLPAGLRDKIEIWLQAGENPPGEDRFSQKEE